MLLDGNYHNLNRCNFRWKHKAGVVAVYHDNCSDQPGGHSPGGLMDVLEFVVFVCVLNMKGPGKSVSEVVAGAGLERFAIVHKRLDGVGCFCAGKFFFLCFASADDRHCQHFFTEICIEMQHLKGPFFGFFCSCVSGVSFLP